MEATKRQVDINDATPRPWAVYREREILRQPSEPVKIVQVDGYGEVLRLITTMPSKSNWPASEANAELIVRAANSHDALLKAAKLWRDKARFWSPEALEYDMAVDELNAAIAAAEKE